MKRDTAVQCTKTSLLRTKQHLIALRLITTLWKKVQEQIGILTRAVNS